MNIFGGDMGNINIIFEDYVKDLKLNSEDKYVYVLRDDVFGCIIMSANKSGIVMAQCNDLHEKYFGKMYSTDVIKGKTMGYEYDIGVLEGFDSVIRFNAIQKYEKAMYIFNCIKMDIVSADSISYVDNLNTDETFYNDILLKKADDGVGKFIIDNRPVYLSPMMLPGTKKTDLDAVTYYKNGNEYFTIKFISHKKNDVYTFMRFLCL